MGGPGGLRGLNRAIDKSCSAVVSLTVIGVNLFSIACYADTVVVPVITAACCGTAAASKVLKRLINQARPRGAPKLSPGMPSNHATSLSFLSIAGAAGIWIASAPTVADIWTRAPDSGNSGGGDGSDAQRTGAALAAAAVLVFGLYSTALRVVCGHHTVAQVLAGYALGTASAVTCLAANYGAYSGERYGGFIDELPPAAQKTLLAACVLIGAVSFYSIMRGSLLLRHPPPAPAGGTGEAAKGMSAKTA